MVARETWPMVLLNNLLVHSHIPRMLLNLSPNIHPRGGWCHSVSALATLIQSALAHAYMYAAVNAVGTYGVDEPCRLG
jgi:hypothetical protein